MRVAIIEIGTNTSKLLIARVGRFPGGFRVVRFESVTTRIGRGSERTGRIGEAGLARTLDAVRSFRRRLEDSRCRRAAAFSTHALRKASNGAAVARRIERALRLPLRVISGREEARFAYLSARHSLSLSRPNTILIDIGGGSTELVAAKRGRVVLARSMSLGALHLTERFIGSDPIDRCEFERLRRHLDRVAFPRLERAGAGRLDPKSIDLVASGGSISSAARVIALTRRGSFVRAGRRRGGRGSSARPRVQTLRLGEIEAFLERCLELPLEKRKKIPGLDPQRADIIPAGVAILLCVMHAARKRVVVANPGGVREGLLIHLFLESDRRSSE